MSGHQCAHCGDATDWRQVVALRRASGRDVVCCSENCAVMWLESLKWSGVSLE